MLLAFALSAVAAACASDDDAPTTAPTTAPARVPTTAPATTDAPVPTEPASTQPVVTEPPATEPVTDPPDTEPPATDPPDTDPPATDPPIAAVGLMEAPEGDAFYVAPDPLPGDHAGQLIWARPLDSVPDGAKGWLVLYRSEDVAGDPIAVSGVVIGPDEPIDDRGVVITWAHGTTGLGDDCAPSKRYVDGAGEMDLAEAFVAQGWTYVATDYEGLGTAGVHPYLVGQSEGRGVLDIVAAAAELDSGATNESPVAIFGHSQGGHAALMAGEIAATYTPQLDIIGTVAAAPPGEMALIETATSAGGGGLGGFGLMMLAGFLDAYPGLPVDAVVNDEWRPLLDAVADTCTTAAFRLAGTATGPRPDGTQNPEWKAVLDENSPGNIVPEAPVLIVHGDADQVVPLVLSELIQGKYCALGVASQRTLYPGADHGGVMIDALDDVIGWIEDRLAGLPPPTNC